MSPKLFLILFFSIILISCRKDKTSTLSLEIHKFNFSSEWTFRKYEEYTGSVAYTVLDTTYYWFESDTIMNRHTRFSPSEVSANSANYTYHKLLFEKRSYFNPQNGLNLNQSQGTRAYIRGDTIENKWYITYTDTTLGNGWEFLAGNEEALLWDFNLDEGDSLNWCRWYVVQEGDDWHAGAKENNISDGFQFESYRLYNPNTPYLNATIVLEGIGSLNGIDKLDPENKLIHYHCSEFDYYPE